MTSPTLARLRLYTQRITGPAFADPAEVVRWLGAMQAQDYQQALWAVGVRTQGATLADVERALEEGRIVRTWPMRGTLHFVPAEDARWMLMLTASRAIARHRGRLAQLELDDKTLERAEDEFRAALAGGRRLSRAAMLQVLEDAGIRTEGQRGYHILWYLAHTGVLCPGPLDGRTQTFVLLDEWVPHSRELSREEALATLARRYFTSHGPATVYDFAWWTGLTVADARQGLAAVQGDLTSIEVDGTTYWMAADTPREVADEPAGIVLLPGFDEYLLGYKDRSAVLAEEHVDGVTPGQNGMFLPIVVADGQVVGTWRRQVKKTAVEMTFNPFVPRDEVEAWDGAPAERYGEFLGLPVVVGGEVAG